MKKKILLLLICGIAFVLSLFAQQDNETVMRALEREVKISGNYIYGETTANTKEEAVKFAKIALLSRINEEIQHHIEWQFAKTIQAKDVEYYIETINLMRGYKFRVIAYIKKENLTAIFHDDKTPDVELYDKNDIPQELEISLPLVVEKAPEPQQTVEEVILQPQENVMSNNTITLDQNLLEQIVTASSLNEILTILASNKRKGKAVYGTMDKLMQPEKAYLIVYKKTGEIIAILDKELNNVRQDFISGKMYGKEILDNNQIIWFQTFNK